MRSLDRDALRRALITLPDEQRRAIELAYFGGHTYREVAVLTNVSPGTAAGRMRLALARLRAALEGER
jgi:RNA polymerase sigma-70 factor (ECF subfamily)